MSSPPRLTFLGAAGTVTGSKYLIEASGTSFLVDCGLFQGPKEWRLRNWEPLPIALERIDFVLLTHAHLDHTGYLPRMVADGYRRPVYATAATIDLCKLLLPDSGHLQEEDAAYANKIGFSRHRPALPLYTRAHAEAALELLEPIEYGSAFEPAPGVRARWREAGHLLGSAFLELDLDLRGGMLRLVFSGDVGRRCFPLLRDPERPERADVLVLESTYGGRRHPGASPAESQRLRLDELEQVITSTTSRGGSVVIPSFAVGRTQELLHTVRELESQSRIPQLPVFVDSPMAVDATGVFRAHRDLFDRESLELLEQGQGPLRCARLTFVRDVEGSKKLNGMVYPAIIIAASGMATGGRVLHHLKHRLPDPRHTIAFAGFQAEGTRGRALIDGAREIKIHGQQVPVRARVLKLEGFSSHADGAGLLGWCAQLQAPPQQTFLVHGEPNARQALAEELRAQRSWSIALPAHQETVILSGGRREHHPSSGGRREPERPERRDAAGHRDRQRRFGSGGGRPPRGRSRRGAHRR